MSNVQSYNALIDRFKAFASGHFILKSFSHGQIDTADLEKFTEYPFMHVVPSNVTYAKGMKTFSFQIVLADLPRDKDDKVEFQREVLSDLQRIAEDLVAEITNHRVLFGDLITVQNVSLEPFLEEFHNTLTGWTISLDLLVPYYWDACSIPAEWNDFFESGSGGTGSILTFVDSITRDEYGNVSLVNDEATPAPNYYYGTNDEGVRGWYLLTDEVGLTCATIGTCQTIIDIEAEIDLLQQDVTDLQADVVAIETELPNKVPYTGATGNVDLGEYELKAGQIEFDTTPTGAAGAAVMRWNDTDGTVDVGLKGGNVTLQVGQESVVRVVNKAGADLLEANYQAVRVRLVSEGGAQGQRLAVVLALADTDADSATTIGLVTETINNNQEGFVTTSGEVRGINTTGSLQGETWVDGDILYLSGTTAGRVTNIKPSAPTHTIIIGYVVYAHANNGKIFVKVDNGYELDELHNVSITTPANNEGLFFESSTSLWKNKTIENVLGYTPFNLPSLTSGSVLFSNGTTIAQDNANLFWDNTNNRLGIGTASPTYALDVVGSIRSGNQFANAVGLILSTVSGRAQLYQSQGVSLAYFSGAVIDGLILRNTGNVLIGTTTDAGFKLDVNGTARVSGNAFFNVGVRVGTSLAGIFPTGTSGRESVIVRSTLFPTDIGEDVILSNGQGDAANTSGTRNIVNISRGFNPTSGTGVFNSIMINAIINQTGGANGITRGLYINPNLTAAADFRAIETTNGKVIFGGTDGILIPRLTTTQRDAIASPATGLQIFNTTEGYHEFYDSFWGWMPIANQNEWMRKWGMEYFNDFGVNNGFSGDGVFQTFPLNGGGYMSFSPLPTGSNYIGFLGLATGVNTNGQNAIRTDLNTGIFFRPASRISLTSRLWVQTLSDATNRYNVIFGLSQGGNSTIANGCVFIYDEGGVGTGTTASPNWQIITAFGSVRTNFVTSVVVSAQTWYSFRIESNSTFTELYYYINDVLVRTETTNIPTSVQNNPIVSITKTAGTTNRAVAVDYLGLKVKLNSAR